uniref:Uncharacterized protein n=1 Tax=Romanomermis culicivorax TaxID=13658 RepID=A0A915KBT6_ROMCU
MGFEDPNFIEEKDIIKRQLFKVYQLMRQEVMARWAMQCQTDLSGYLCPADIKNPAKATDHTLLSRVFSKVLKAGPRKKKLNQWEDLSDREDMDTLDQQVNRTN